jgi:hypothetical protein
MHVTPCGDHAMDQGTLMLRISVLNESTSTTSAVIRGMLPALQTQWNRDLAQVWGIDRVVLQQVPKRRKPKPGSWWLVFLDDAEQANNLAVHDLTHEGLPIAKVFVDAVLAKKASLSVAASHELCEMAVDPWLNNAYQDSKGVFWAGEICDPVQGDRYGYRIGGTLVSDFVTPDWFAHAHSTRHVDFKRRCMKPFSVLPGAYAQRYDTRRGWVRVNGKTLKPETRATSQPGSRTERRTRVGSGRWRATAP